MIISIYLMMISLPATVPVPPSLALPDSASRGGNDDGVAYTVSYKDYSLSTAIYREGALSSPPSFLCINQPGNSASFGTPLTLKSFYNAAATYKISLNRTLATAA